MVLPFFFLRCVDSGIAGPEGTKNLAGKCPPPGSDPFSDVQFGENYVNLSSQFAASVDCGFEFDKSSQPFIRSHNKARIVAAMWRISGTSSFFFELSDATNSTVGSDQIDCVNFRPNRATEWDSTPIKMQPASSLDTPLLAEADGAVAYHSENFQSAAFPDAAAIGGAREGMPIHSGEWLLNS